MNENYLLCLHVVVVVDVVVEEVVVVVDAVVVDVVVVVDVDVVVVVSVVVVDVVDVVVVTVVLVSMNSCKRKQDLFDYLLLKCEAYQ